MKGSLKSYPSFHTDSNVAAPSKITTTIALFLSRLSGATDSAPRPPWRTARRPLLRPNTGLAPPVCQRYSGEISVMIDSLEVPVLRFEEVTPERWDDFETLFASRGGPKHCWCMAWRALPSDCRGDGVAKKRAMKNRIVGGQQVGLLGFLGSEPVAWCSVAPRDSYRPLGGLDDDEATVWSLACMFVKRELRGKGLSKELIRAAIHHSHRRGADILEAYPVDPESPSYRFMGFVPAFVELGFTEVGRAGSRRHVMRLDLR